MADFQQDWLSHFGVCNNALFWARVNSLHRRHNDRDGIWNHQLHDCLLSRSFERRSKKASKLLYVVISWLHNCGPYQTYHWHRLLIISTICVQSNMLLHWGFDVAFKLKSILWYNSLGLSFNLMRYRCYKYSPAMNWPKCNILAALGIMAWYDAPTLEYSEKLALITKHNRST